MEQGSWEQGLEAPRRTPRNAGQGPRSPSAESWQASGWRGVSIQPSHTSRGSWRPWTQHLGKGTEHAHHLPCLGRGRAPCPADVARAASGTHPSSDPASSRNYTSAAPKLLHQAFPDTKQRSQGWRVPLQPSARQWGMLGATEIHLLVQRQGCPPQLSHPGSTALCGSGAPGQ